MLKKLNKKTYILISFTLSILFNIYLFSQAYDQGISIILSDPEMFGFFLLSIYIVGAWPSGFRKISLLKPFKADGKLYIGSRSHSIISKLLAAALFLTFAFVLIGMFVSPFILIYEIYEINIGKLKTRKE